MILRPVRPQSPTGPPMTKRPVGLTSKPVAQLGLVVQLGRQLRGYDVLPQVGPRSAALVDASACWVEISTFSMLDRLGRRRTRTVTWVLPSGRRYGSWPSLRTSAARRASRCARRSAAASAPASRWSRSRTSCPGRRRRPVELVLAVGPYASRSRQVDALGDVRRLLVDRDDDRATSCRRSRDRRVVADPADRVAGELRVVDVDAVVISPATTTRPVLISVSHATRANGSPVSAASSTASEIWSAILSGCPSVTDSEVKYPLSIAVS
jgi:hypothetical protein